MEKLPTATLEPYEWYVNCPHCGDGMFVVHDTMFTDDGSIKTQQCTDEECSKLFEVRLPI